MQIGKCPTNSLVQTLAMSGPLGKTRICLCPQSTSERALGAEQWGENPQGRGAWELRASEVFLEISSLDPSWVRKLIAHSQVLKPAALAWTSRCSDSLQLCKSEAFPLQDPRSHWHGDTGDTCFEAAGSREAAAQEGTGLFLAMARRG